MLARVLEMPGPTGWMHPGWAADIPWLVQGTTGEDAGDMTFFGTSPVRETLARWRRLREATGIARAVHGRQVHAAAVAVHEGGPPGIVLLDDIDGHVTGDAGVLLTVSIADCVPVFLVDPDARRVALLHAGWRGAAAGILDAGMRALGSTADRLRMHLGPAICGHCYEVGPEVFEALGLAGRGKGMLDLREWLAARALEAGVSADAITISGHCTRCGHGFYSHRGGRAERQVAFVGIGTEA